MEENKARPENTEIMIKDGGERTHPNPNPILSVISKFQGFFKFPPPQKRNDAASEPDAVVSKQPTTPEEEESKTVVVKFPHAQPEMPSLKLESEGSEQDTNPIVLWQVYAIGGFFVLRWVLARLKERRAKKRSSDDEPSPSPADG